MACGDAVERGLLGENPLRFAKVPEAVVSDRVTWTEDERRRFIAAAARHRLGFAIRLVLATGLRRGEVLALRWSDIDFDSGRLQVARQLVIESGRCRLKTLDPEHGSRAVLLPHDIVTMLARHRRAQDGERASAGVRWRDGDLVFATPTGGWVAPDRFAAVMDDLVGTAGIRRVTPEGLRRMAPARSAP